ncbi:MAG: hypothetical protein R2764_08240 [Bacteroidales bacterium]
MDILINQDSPLRKVPIVLEKRQVLLIDGIRYSLDIVDISFQKLNEYLYNLSFTEEGLCPSLPSIYSEVWNIVNNTSIFIKLLISFPVIDYEVLLKEIFVINDLRNSHQHLNQRIDEIFLKEELPIFGELSWYAKKHSNSDNGIICTIHSGFFTNKTKTSMKPVNPSGKSNEFLINNITLTGIKRVKKTKDEIQFLKTRVDLNHVYQELRRIVLNIEHQFLEQFKSVPTDQVHENDLVLKLFVRKPSEAELSNLYETK